MKAKIIKIPVSDDLDGFSDQELLLMLEKLKNDSLMHKYISKAIERKKEEEYEMDVYSTEDAFRRNYLKGFIAGLIWHLDADKRISEVIEDRANKENDLQA